MYTIISKRIRPLMNILHVHDPPSKRNRNYILFQLASRKIHIFCVLIWTYFPLLIRGVNIYYLPWCSIPGAFKMKMQIFDLSWSYVGVRRNLSTWILLNYVLYRRIKFYTVAKSNINQYTSCKLTSKWLQPLSSRNVYDHCLHAYQLSYTCLLVTI